MTPLPTLLLALAALALAAPAHAAPGSHARASAPGLRTRAEDGVVHITMARRGPTQAFRDQLSRSLQRSIERRQFGGGGGSGDSGDSSTSGNASAPVASAVAGGTSASLVNWRRSLSYTVQVDIGTPPQPFHLLVDTGSPDLWVFGQGCTGDCRGGLPFQPALSSSYKASDTVLNLQYAKGVNQGVFGKDTVTVAGQTVQNFDVGLVSYAEDTGFEDTDMSGILGMSFPFPVSSKSFHGDPFWVPLVDYWNNKEFALYLGRDPTTLSRVEATSIENGGLLSLGGVDTSLFQGEINYVGLVPTSQEVVVPTIGSGPANSTGNFTSSITGTNQTLYWSVPLDSITVNGYNVSPGRRAGDNVAIIDSGTTIIFGPAAAVTAFYGEIDGSAQVYDSGYGGRLWLFPCKNMNKIKVSFNFGGQQYPIEGSDLIFAVGTGGLCAGAVQASTSSMGEGWLVGETFLTNVYSVYRADPPAVGFALLSDSANIKYGSSSSGNSSGSGSGSSSSAATSAGVSSALVAAAVLGATSLIF